MKKVMKVMSMAMIFVSVAMATSVGGNPEVFKRDVPVVVQWGGGNNCDFIEHLMGMCRSSENSLVDN